MHHKQPSIYALRDLTRPLILFQEKIHNDGKIAIDLHKFNFSLDLDEISNIRLTCVFSRDMILDWCVPAGL